MAYRVSSANRILYWLKLSTILLLLIILPGRADAQEPDLLCHGRLVTELNFTGPTLESGTDLLAGAIYRYTNVTTGVDALVEIMGFVNGGGLNTIDNDSGLVNYFQPELNTTGTSAADFRISFVVTGTTTPVLIDYAASGIDIDGNNASLREYAEFETTLVQYLLSSSTQLDVDASGPSLPSRIRFESRTSLVAPGIDPTAKANVVTAYFTDVTSFEYRIGTLGSGTMTRLTSLGFDCPSLLPSPISISTRDEDFGDAPVINYGNPIHTLVAGIQLGATNTADTGPYDSPTASGDTGDDGVTVPSFSKGETQVLNVSVTGAGGYLQAWFDWNDDGDFTDSGEQVATDIQDTDADGSIALFVTAPSTAATATTFARFRWSTASGLIEQDAAGDGEVEDYSFTISALNPSCPIGYTLTGQTGNADTVITSVVNSTNALGVLSPIGSTATDANSARNNSANPVLTLQLADFIPQDSILTLSLARNDTISNYQISTSPDNTAYTTITTINQGTLDVLDRISIVVPTGGARYVSISRIGGSTWIDSVEYDTICQPPAILTAAKTVEILDGMYAIPGSDAKYTITASNTGGGSADTDTIFFVDQIPADLIYIYDDVDSTGPETDEVVFTDIAASGLTFNLATDVGFSTSATKPATFAACSDPVVAGENPTITYICINPKGAFLAGDPDPTFSVAFRVRIK